MSKPTSISDAPSIIDDVIVADTVPGHIVAFNADGKTATVVTEHELIERVPLTYLSRVEPS